MLLRWDGYNTTTWLHACEVREPQTKRPLRRKPKRDDWPTLRSPENLQRLDGVSVRRDDGSYGERLIVYINDPYNGNVSLHLTLYCTHNNVTIGMCSTIWLTASAWGRARHCIGHTCSWALSRDG